MADHGDYHLPKDEFPNFIRNIEDIVLEQTCHPSDVIAKIKERYRKFNDDAADDHVVNNVSHAIRAQSAVDGGAIEFNVSMKCFLVKGTVVSCERL